ncbi:MAG: crossover junction endodeoxyribonuclease RuvC [Verrucomicrobiaceae bacterium]|nr:crossover junction endodeoxyribonuclease RuvC [Verrucomicrobiaceae bacterium]
MASSPSPAPAPVDRVLSIDPALRKTGFAVLEKAGKDIRLITYGVIHNVPKLLPSGCLVAIREQLVEAIRIHAPTVCAIEATIFVQSYATAIVLGAARGAALIAAAEHGLAIYEYSPKEVKQAAVGKGAAQKEQVAFMIRSMLRLRETPPPDAADAIAVGLAHFQAADANKAMQVERRRV